MKNMKLTAPYLLWLYAIMPFSLLCVGIDMAFLDFRLKDYLVTRPDILSLWAFLFTLPHVIGSHVTLFDKEYAHHYKKKIIIGLAISMFLAIFVRAAFGFKVFFFAIATYNMYHVLMQQYGISLMLLSKKPDNYYKGWKYLSLIGSTILYVLIFGGNFFTPEMVRWANLIVLVVLVAALPFVAGMIKGVPNDKPPVNRWYFYSTILMVYVSWALYVGGYPFFAVLIPRFIHDVTAFSVYAVHDQNRNTPVIHNMFYKALAFTKIPPAVSCVPLSIVLGIIFGVLQNEYPVMSNFNFTVVLLHYFMEGYIWKSGSLHRNSLPIIK